MALTAQQKQWIEQLARLVGSAPAIDGDVDSRRDGAESAKRSSFTPDAQMTQADADGSDVELLELRHLVITPDPLSLQPGQRVPLTAEAVDIGGTPMDVTLAATWSSSDTAVVAVDSQGRVTGGNVSKAGSATIRAEYPDANLHATLTVQVAPRPAPPAPAPPAPPAPPLARLRIEPSPLLLAVDAVAPLEATGVYADGHEQSETQALRWQTSAAHVATVNEGGQVRGRALGRATLTAIEPNSRVEARVDVHVVPAKWPVALEVTPREPSVHASDFVTFRVVAQFADRSSGPLEDPVEWTSSDDKVMRIDAQGKAMARFGGSTVITATWRGNTDDGSRITVSGSTNAGVPSISALAIETPQPPLLAGQRRRLKAIGIYTDRSRRERALVSWTSHDPQVLSVDRDGNASARQAGTARVSAMLTDAPHIKPAGATLTVGAPALTELRWRTDGPNAFSGKLVRGERMRFVAVGVYPLGSGQETLRDLPDAVWSSSDEAIATVDRQGLLSALKAGRVMIEAEDRGGMVNVTIPVRIEEAAPAAPARDTSAAPPELARPYRAAKDGYDALMQQQRELDGVPQLVKSLEQVLADLAGAKEDAVAKAQMAEQQNQQLQAIRLQIDSFGRHAESARTHLRRVQEEIDQHQLGHQVAALREKGVEEMKNIEFGLSLLKAGASAAKDPLAAATELLDGLVKRFHVSAWTIEADRLQRQLDARRHKLLLDYLGDAKTELNHANQALTQGSALAARASALFDRLREDAESRFDAGAAKGSFTFAQLTRPLAMADRIVDVLVPALQRDAGSVNAAYTAIKRGGGVDASSAAGLTMKAMNDEALGWWKQAAHAGRQADAQRQQLRQLRQQANTRLAFVKPAATGGRKP